MRVSDNDSNNQNDKQCVLDDADNSTNRLTLSANDEGVHLVSDMQAGEEHNGERGVAGADQGLCSV